MSSGAGDSFEIGAGELNPNAAVEAVRDPACGAVATFIGTVRGTNDGRTVLHLEYEVHESMARKQLARLAGELKKQHGVRHVAVHHRSGVVPVGGISASIAVSSPHRRGALAAVAQAIEALKKDVPIWKKEVYPDGHRWMEGS